MVILATLLVFSTFSVIPISLGSPLSDFNDSGREIRIFAGATTSQEPRLSSEENVLTSNTPTGTKYMLYEHHGYTWVDAEKVPSDDGGGIGPDPGEDDDWLCWTATATNILEWTGWGLVSGMWDTDAIFDKHKLYFNDTGSWMDASWRWWLNGYEPGTPLKLVTGGGNYWPAYTWTNYYLNEDDDADVLNAIDDWLRAGYGVGIGIFNGGHAITVWGFNYDSTVDKNTNPHDYYLGIWISDSDSDKSNPKALDRLSYYEVEWNSTANWWYMPNYGGGWMISRVQALKPFPSGYRPVADAGGPYVVNEGTSVNFDGSGSSDADFDPIKYRWDIDFNGTWDTSWRANATWNTAWSSSATTSHTWNDDYSGDVVLQIVADHLLDLDATTITVNNVAPNITVTGDTIDENGVATVTGTITDPGALDTFTVTIDWGEGSPESYSYPAGSTALSENHQYLDDDPSGTFSDVYTVTVTVEDDDGGSDTASTTVTVNNVNPVVEALTLAQPNDQFILPTIHGLNFTGNFTDVGTLDTHTAVWDWGDSTNTGGTVVESGGSGTATGTHTYSTPGVYTITLTVTDDDTGDDIATMEITVVTVEEAAHITNEYIQDLPDEAFKSNPKQRKKAFSNIFSAIDDMLADDEYRGIIQDLRNNVREKADGHVDGKLRNDWIIDPAVQTEICHKIDDITAYLETLL